MKRTIVYKKTLMNQAFPIRGSKKLPLVVILTAKSEFNADLIQKFSKKMIDEIKSFRRKHRIDSEDLNIEFKISDEVETKKIDTFKTFESGTERQQNFKPTDILQKNINEEIEPIFKFEKRDGQQEELQALERKYQVEEKNESKVFKLESDTQSEYYKHEKKNESKENLDCRSKEIEKDRVNIYTGEGLVDKISTHISNCIEIKNYEGISEDNIPEIVLENQLIAEKFCRNQENDKKITNPLNYTDSRGLKYNNYLQNIMNKKRIELMRQNKTFFGIKEKKDIVQSAGRTRKGLFGFINQLLCCGDSDQ
jgi:hypothetical protein